MLSRSLRFLLIVIGCSVIAGWTTTGIAAPSSSVLQVGWGADPTTLDPAFQVDTPSGCVIRHVMDTLVDLDPSDLTVKPLLAKSWKLLDDKTYRFSLREGVTFQDGPPFNAEAVKYSLERYIAPETRSPRAWYLDCIDKIRAIDDHTVEISLKYPFGPFLAHLTYFGAAIVSPKSARESGLKGFGSQPVGTGPFRFKEWKRGEEVSLTRNESYWGKASTLKEIRFKAITETSTRTIALETGEIDMALDLFAHDADRLKKLPGINVMTSPNLRTVFIAMNTKAKPFDDPRVREAVHLATDTEGLVKTLFGEYALVPSGVMPSFLAGGKKFPKEYDIKKAKDLLAKAGYPDGFKTELWTCVGRYYQDKESAIFVANQLEKVGIQASVKVFEFAAYMKALVDRKYTGMVLGGWGSATGDADQYLFPNFHSSQASGNRNMANYSNAEVDRLIELARRTADRGSRLKAYQRALEIIEEDHPWVPLYIPTQVFALKNYVKGFVPRLNEVVLVDSVSLGN